MTVELQESVRYNESLHAIEIPYVPLDHSLFNEALASLDFNEIEREIMIRKLQEVSKQSVIRWATATNTIENY